MDDNGEMKQDESSALVRAADLTAVELDKLPSRQMQDILKQVLRSEQNSALMHQSHVSHSNNLPPAN